MVARRALIALHDTARIGSLAPVLSQLGFELIASRAAAAAIRAEGVPVVEIGELIGGTAAPARVEALHPRLHAALLAPRGSGSDAAAETLDWVIVDLPSLPGDPGRAATFDELLLTLDLNGPALARTAAAAFAHVTVLVDKDDWSPAVRALQQHGEVPLDQRRRLAAKAIARVARYEDAIATELAALEPAGPRRALPLLLSLQAEGIADLTTGDNPHQRAGLYKIGAPPEGALAQLLLVGYAQRTPSFHEVLDAAAAIEAAAEHDAPTAVLEIRRKPVAVACAQSLGDAVRAALALHDGSFAGGVLAVNRPFDDESAAAVVKVPISSVVAPRYEMTAMDALVARRDLPLMALADLLPRDRRGQCWVQVDGGLVLQERDATGAGEVERGRVATARAPTEAELIALDFAWKVAKHARSDAAVLACAGPGGTLSTVGVGAGCASLPEAFEVALSQAGARARGAVLACDGAILSTRVIAMARRAGVACVVEPGGAPEGAEVIAAADSAGMAMLLTGVSHLRYA